MEKRLMYQVCILILASVASYAQVEQRKGACGNPSYLLLDDVGKPAWLADKTLRENATNKPEGKIGGTVCISRDMIVVVEITINSDGIVECARANGRKGHPLIKASALEAARKWTFKPFIQNGRQVAAQGRLELFFQRNSGLDNPNQPPLIIK